jgi:phage terminase large subunit-like protein
MKENGHYQTVHDSVALSMTNTGQRDHEDPASQHSSLKQQLHEHQEDAQEMFSKRLNLWISGSLSFSFQYAAAEIQSLMETFSTSS